MLVLACLRLVRRFWPFLTAVFAIVQIPFSPAHYRGKGLPKTLSIWKICGLARPYAAISPTTKNLPAFSGDLPHFPKSALARQVPIIYASFRFGA
jgi:hypothetical protein